MGIDDDKIFSEEYDSSGTSNQPISVVEENNSSYESSSNTAEEEASYSLSKPKRIIIKAVISNDKS